MEYRILVYYRNNLIRKDFMFFEFIKKRECFEALKFLNQDGTPAKPGTLTAFIEWLPDITVEGRSSPERFRKALEALEAAHQLKSGQVWIIRSHILNQSDEYA